MPRPDFCADVVFHAPTAECERDPMPQVGDVVWDPKGGEGHVLNAQSHCDDLAYCGYCGGMPTECGVFTTCECSPGIAWCSDHHVYAIERHPFE